MLAHAKVYIIPHSRAATGYVRSSDVMLACTRRALWSRFAHVPRWRACWCSVRRRAKPSPPSDRSCCCNRSTAAIWSLDYFTGNFRVDLDHRAGTPVNVVQVVVGPTGFVGAPERAVVDYIRSTFADRPKPDLIVTCRRARGGIRAQVPTAALSRHAAPVCGCRSAISAGRAPWRERDRRRGRSTIILS